MKSLLAAALLGISVILHASQEAIFPIGSLRMESASLGDWGPVVIDATQDEKGMQRFGVQAFGRTYLLTPSQLREIGGVMYNSIQISREAGYAELGGRTIYVKLGVGFTSGQLSRTRYVVVTEAGTIIVQDQLMPGDGSR
jgi:hypothetical protein